MNKILDKRNSLERFIREQTLGPGINGYKFVDLENELLLEKDKTANRIFFINKGCLRLYYSNSDHSISTRFMAFENID